MRLNSKFVQFSSNPENVNTVEEILDSSELKLLNEDSLVSFVLTLCRESDNNDEIIRLFEKVFFEYCTQQCCVEFLNFVNEVVESLSVRSLIKCMSSRFVKSQIQLNPQFVNGRHKIPYTEITNDDLLNGILRRENKKENVLMEASSTYINNYAYNLIDENDRNCFQSNNFENSYFQASLKDGKEFIVKNYTVKGKKIV